MKIKNKIKHSLLTAAILLTVSGGSAYAMPTGGNVTMGNVTNVANPAEIMTANANSIINWDSFSVGVGEKVTFDTQKFMVLNRVIGGQESQILGMLSDQGQGKLLLINPAGIVLGENAVINANDLVLSTLRISDSEFKKLINGNSAIFEDVANDRGEIKLKSGTNLTLNEALRLYGGKITIADGVEIISKENSSAKVEIAAGIEGVTDLKKHHSNTYAMGTDVEIGDANIGTMSNPISNITIKSSKTTLDKADVVVNGNNNDEQHNIIITSAITNINSSKLLNRCGDIFIANTRRGSWSYDKDGSIKTFSAVADPDYEVSVRNSNINTEKEKNITIIGGNVTLDHSQLNSGKDIFVGAVKTYDSVEGVRTATTYDSSIINADKDTVIHARGYAEAYGANLNIQAQRFDNVIDSTNPFVQIMGENGISLDDIAQYLKDHPEYENTITDILNTRLQYDLKDPKNEKLDNDPRLEKIIEFRDKINAEKEMAKLLEREKKMIEIGLIVPIRNDKELYTYSEDALTKIKNLLSIIKDVTGNEYTGLGKAYIETEKTIKEYSELENPTGADILNLSSKVIDLFENSIGVIGKLPIDQVQKLMNNTSFPGAVEAVSKSVGVMAKVGFLSQDIHSGKWEDALDDIPPVFNDLADMFGSIEHLKNGTIGPKTLISNAECAVTLAKAGINGAYQLEKSLLKYTKDGNCTADDLSSIFSEVSLSMGEAISNHGLGLGDMLYDKIRNKYGTQDDGLSNAEQAAEGYRILGREIAKAMIEKEGNTLEKIGAGISAGNKIVWNAFVTLIDVIKN